MSYTRSDLIVALITVVATTVLSVIIHLQFHDPSVTIVTAFAGAVIGLFIDLRVALREIAQKPLSALEQSYLVLEKDKCPLFRQAAIEKYGEVTSFLANLQNNVIEIDSLGDVYPFLEFLFKKLAIIKEIHATSCGELDEWQEAESWWGGHYLRLHIAAHNRGAHVSRVFILDNENESTIAKHVFDENIRAKVDVKYVIKNLVHQTDLHNVDNALIFCDKAHRPVYCLHAFHGPNGEFVKAYVYRDEEHTIPYYEAVRRIEASSTSVEH